ncbi:hypothetical protein [Cohnella fermenti]|uniref:Uncharacterized protein n=1 Tax=Cohnella fermenti TaxID=2565925 RepID=A0A4S4BMR0_9BACL|nr:hypothetical protein [Cohnella fermenti]THF75923.1 hypothetical protein E6C55_20700 [Cohnella fermenti]
MRRRYGPVAIVLFALIAVGIVGQILRGASSLLIPVVLIAIVYLLYKFPPNRWGRSSSGESSKYRQAAAKSRQRGLAKEREESQSRAKRRAAPFRVIEGNKKNDEEPPRYH